ncbi:YceI family protein [Patulibacter americanus]|uniref:YceI family protein n=1 Tax=Patulibacter americanus TaxID=588672 RepID=UPI0003B6D30D|nr:YceI family protein [Patulibacter americanus]
MSTQNATPRTTSTTDVPAGSYRLDPAASTVTFTTRAMFGLMKVRGHFGRVDGTLDVGADGPASGAMHVDVETIDTGIARRDAHLRRSDFFHTEEHPTAVFTLDTLRLDGPEGPRVTGTLELRDKTVPIDSPVTLATSGERLRVDADVEIDHHAAGLPFRTPLLVSGRARVVVALVFAAA